MAEEDIKIGAPGVDVEQVVADIRRSVEEKRRKGVYDDPRLARAGRADLLQPGSHAGLLDGCLDSLADAACVDINDFDIHERRARFARLLVPVKRLIWKALRFYTYRLWSQQNQVNAMFLSALEAMDARCREKHLELEKRIERLESDRKPAS
jgi:hypothetical protein